MAVLCPPHLAEQWQRELKEKFHLDAELCISSTAARDWNGNVQRESRLFDCFRSWWYPGLRGIPDARRNDFLALP